MYSACDSLGGYLLTALRNTGQFKALTIIFPTVDEHTVPDDTKPPKGHTSPPNPLESTI